MQNNKVVPYTVKENLLLASLVDQHNIVENKQTDAVTIQTKNEEWQKIVEAYNAQAGDISIKRTAAQLKKLWKNLKQRKRKSTTAIKYNRLLTGGGPPPKEDIDLVMESVDDAASHMDVTVDCPWDSTTEFERSNVDANLDDSEASCPKSLSLAVSLDSSNIHHSDTSSSRNESLSSSISSAQPRKKRSVELVENEANLRVIKIKESVDQQREFHSIRMKVEEETLKKISAERRKMEAKAELTEQKLNLFKKEHNLE